MKEFVEQVMCLVEKMSGTRQCPHHFNTDTDIFRREGHILKLVGDHSCLHVSEIARKFGITKGSVSQSLKKLERKGLIQKNPDENNNTRIQVRLTEKGKTAYQGHEAYHKKNNSEFYSFLENLDQSEFQILKDFIAKIDKLWDEHL